MDLCSAKEAKLKQELELARWKAKRDDEREEYRLRMERERLDLGCFHH